VKEKTTIIPEADITSFTAEDFKQKILMLINSSSGDVVLDFKRVEKVDSVGLDVLRAAHNTLLQKERGMKIVNVSDDIYGLFGAMRLHRCIPVERVEACEECVAI